MKISREQIKKMIGFEVDNMNFVITELINWIKNYEYSYEVIDNMLVKEDLQQDIDLELYTIEGFINDWFCTLEDKAESYLLNMDKRNEKELKLINEFNMLMVGLKEINNKFKSQEKFC